MFRKNPYYPNQMPPWATMPMATPRPTMPMPQSTLGAIVDAPPTTMEAPDFEMEPGAPVQQDIRYTQGYLRSKIGDYVKIEFLLGTNMLVDREGIIEEVGISYVVLRETGTNDELMCDIYSIKFVRIFDDQDRRKKLR